MDSSNKDRRCKGSSFRHVELYLWKQSLVYENFFSYLLKNVRLKHEM